jgi:arylsulfatase A-like enzyme
MASGRHARRIARCVVTTFFLTSLLLAGCKPDGALNSDADLETQADAAAKKAPNIVWLSVESVRADHVGCYGYERDTTPNLDKLAAEATVFEHADSVTSWTLTSHTSMFTGLYPSAHRVIGPKDKLADSYTTIAEVLRDAGYQTAAVVSGPYLSKAHNLQQGFEYVDDSPIQHIKGASADVTNPDLEKALFKYLKAQRDPDRPFMLFAYYWDPHSEYIPPPPYDTMFVPPGAQPIKTVLYMPAFQLGRHINQPQLDWLIAQYDGEIRCTDDYIGRFFDLLREFDLWENTMVIVTADHGEEFYEHGRNAHKNTLHVESVHVPLIIKWPGNREPTRDARQVSLVDLFPTVLEVAGQTTSVPHNGSSLRAEPNPNRATFLELQTLWSYTNKRTKEKWLERKRWSAIRRGTYKLIHVVPQEDRAGVALDPHWALYDCASDPREQHPITTDRPEVTGELQAALSEWQAAMTLLARTWAPGGSARLTPEEEQRLRGLGYIP